MGILQAAYRTYDSQSFRVGETEAGQEPLTPVSHAMQNAHIEIVISTEGQFRSASAIEKKFAKTIIPVTLESANRTGGNTKAHPLSDQLRYLAGFGGDKHEVYVAQLERWASSAFSHPKVQAVLCYIRGGSIIQDLIQAGVIAVDEHGNFADKKIEGIEYPKCLVRWAVIPAPEGVRSACYEDATLFERYAAFNADLCAGMARDICLISGIEDASCDMHPKGVVASNFGAKLISANDSAGFTYRGRFTQPEQAYSVGYTASQKAHSALRWVVANHGVAMGDRTFVCWNPDGNPVPPPLFGQEPEAATDFASYKKQLLESLGGYRQSLKPDDDVVIASMDAATTGRLSVTYYNELKASDFLDRLERWYATFCWRYRLGVQSPSLKRVALCAFGTQRGEFLDCDAKVLRDHVQRLLRCVVDSQPLPLDIVKALVNKASNPLAYSAKNRGTILATACAALRKSLNDKLNEEVWTLALDPTNTDRSYLFGRLLAVAELAERRTYQQGENREPNAIRMQAVFSQRPMYAWRIIRESLIPYFAKLRPGSRVFYQSLIDEISGMLPDADDPELSKKLADTYLLGYSHQRTTLYTKEDATSNATDSASNDASNDEEEHNNESADQ